VGITFYAFQPITCRSERSGRRPTRVTRHNTGRCRTEIEHLTRIVALSLGRHVLLQDCVTCSLISLRARALLTTPLVRTCKLQLVCSMDATRRRGCCHEQCFAVKLTLRLAANNLSTFRWMTPPDRHSLAFGNVIGTQIGQSITAE